MIKESEDEEDELEAGADDEEDASDVVVEEPVDRVLTVAVPVDDC